MFLKLLLLSSAFIFPCLASSSEEEEDKFLTSQVIEITGSAVNFPTVIKREEEGIFVDDFYKDILATRTYPLHPTALEKDLNQFAQELDQKTFNPLSKKVIAGGVLSGLIGAVTPYPSCGSTIYYVGDFLHVPISSAASKALIAWIITTTTPAFAQQSFRVATKLFHQQTLTETQREGEAVPHCLRKSKSHQVAKALLLPSSAINAMIPVLLLREAEKIFPLFFAATAAPFYFAWLENSYRVGAKNLDQAFEYYSYVPRTTLLKKEILRKQIRQFKEAISANDHLVFEIFKNIDKQKRQNFSKNDGDLFAFSSYFVRSALRHEGENDDEDAAATLLNFKIDIENHEHSFTDDLASWLSTAVTGASIYTKYTISQHLIESLLTEIGLNSQEAYIASVSLSSFSTAYRLATTNYSQQDYFKGWRGVFSFKENLTALRKAATAAASINAGIFSLWNFAYGLNLFENDSIPSKIATLGPAFLVDFAYYQQFFGKNSSQFITNASSGISHLFNARGVDLKRASLIKDADLVEKVVEHADVETIEMLYKLINKAV